MGEGIGAALGLHIDEAFEFCAPRYFDFANDETREEIRRAELWFESALSDAPSPFMPRIKLDRSAIQIQSLGDLRDADHLKSDEFKPGMEEKTASSKLDTMCPIRSASRRKDTGLPRLPRAEISSSATETAPMGSRSQSAVEAHKLKGQKVSAQAASLGSTDGTTSKTANKTQQKKKESALKPLNHQTSAILSEKAIKPRSSMRCPSAVAAKNASASDIAQENQAIKKQKLDGGKCRQNLNAKTHMLLHKSKKGLTSNGFTEPTPFISAAEIAQKFFSNSRDVDFSQNGLFSHASYKSMVDTASEVKRRPKLTLTRPKELMFETAQRVRAVRVKSAQELEEEMLAKMPKFKARPVNKKILEGPSLPAPPRSTPHLPEFQEFHLRTMERANQHAEVSSVVSSTMDSSSQNQARAPPRLTEPRAPLLQTSLRTRPTRTKTTEEIKLEEFENFPKFKARPINQKIFESKGDLGMFCNPKRQVTIPQDFHFATSERLGQPTSSSSVMDLFDKLSLRSESSRHDCPEIPKLTVTNPFQLHTEERGAEKDRKFAEQILQKQQEDEKARIPKALPYPYTTDYPVIPPKPDPKQCTNPEVFQLESLVRHEEEMQKKLEEKERKEKEDAQRRMFRAQLMKEDPIPVPQRERRPLTEIQEFVLNVDNRAISRSEFDKKIMEKEMVYKRIREESETAKQIEEEKAVKQMRRTMVPQARPIPKFDRPFFPERSTKEITKPRSPNFLVDQRQQRHRQRLATQLR